MTPDERFDKLCYRGSACAELTKASASARRRDQCLGGEGWMAGIAGPVCDGESQDSPSSFFQR